MLSLRTLFSQITKITKFSQKFPGPVLLPVDCQTVFHTETRSHPGVSVWNSHRRLHRTWFPWCVGPVKDTLTAPFRCSSSRIKYIKEASFHLNPIDVASGTPSILPHPNFFLNISAPASPVNIFTQNKIQPSTVVSDITPYIPYAICFFHHVRLSTIVHVCPPKIGGANFHLNIFF